MDEPLRTSDLNTAIVHLYRGEISRANVWRNRLDVTTNWALIATGAAISFAFSQPSTHHSVIILNTILITLFLMIESRRYRYYELWSYRIRLLDTAFYANILTPPHHANLDWTKQLVESLSYPKFPVSHLEAVGRRLRRNYIWIYLVLLGTWSAKLMLYPDGLQSWDDLFQRARIGVLEGKVVIAVVFLFYFLLMSLALFTRHLRESVGEVFPDSKGSNFISE